MNPIERAARAMHESARPEWPWEDPDCEPLRRIYRDAARAMILSLREPSDGMREAGSEVIRYVGEEETAESYRNDAANAWRFMIDAALNEGG